MTRDDIIKLAREAGYKHPDAVGACEDFAYFDLERFAALVAAHECEACARVCENMTLEWEDQPAIAQAELATMMDCALAIRGRGQQ
jgi:hypothetical protein